MSLSEWESSSACVSEEKKAKVKISMSDKYKGKRHMLSLFLTQLNTYIHFNWDLFSSKTEKIMFTVTYLKSDALNWFKSTLKNYLNNTINKCENIMNKIFTNYKTFKIRIKVVFEKIYEEQTAERELSLLKQIKAAGIYAANFQ